MPTTAQWEKMIESHLEDKLVASRRLLQLSWGVTEAQKIEIREIIAILTRTTKEMWRD